MARLRRERLRWAIAGVLVVALAVAAGVAWPLVQRYTGAAPPAQFYERVQLDPALDTPKFSEAWNQAAAADVLKLDLMQTDHKFLDELVAS
jgi:hypothetical protein